MIGFVKGNKKPEFTLEYVDGHCIPYACHYDESSILTKNGELLQAIKIEGDLDQIINENPDFDLREIIRKSIIDNVNSSKIAFWFHTIRRKKNLDSINHYSWTFAKDTHEAWAQKNHWRSKFVNELYISILYEGDNTALKDNFALSLIPKALKKLHLNKLETNSKALDEVVSKLYESLKDYGAKRLKIQHDRFGAHSEILEYLTKITCLRSKRIALPIQNLENIFCKTKIAFGGNTLEIIDEKEKHFAAVFTIKEYHEFTSKALDKLLRVSTEYIISQTLNFVDAKIAKKDFEYLNYILGTVSKDEELRISCGLADIMDSDKGKPTDYGSQQMTLTVVGESLEELSRSVINTCNELKKLGILAVREDLHIALCFWSQLPGNFVFFRRASYINTSKTASFMSLYNTPSGKKTNIWGNSITLFRRENAAPHFFNLHVENNGNTIIVGNQNSLKNTLTNFIISESSKYEPNVLYIDQFSNSHFTLKALGGRYEIISLKGDKPVFRFNPFAMADLKENRDFLKNFIVFLTFYNESPTDEQKNKIFAAVDNLFANIALGSRKISLLLDFIEDQVIKDSLSQWCKPNKLGFLFDNDYDEIGIGSKVLGINISELLVENIHATYALVNYCIYQYNQVLDKTPSIMVINDANTLLNHQIFSSILPNILDSLTNNNALSILVCDSKKPIIENIKQIYSKIATFLFLPELEPKIYQAAFQLTDAEVLAIKKMKALYRHFMIKQGSERMVVELNLDGLDYTFKALSGGSDTIEAMEKAIKEIGDNPNRWIIPFYKNLIPLE